jgi:hypothetical protein
VEKNAKCFISYCHDDIPNGAVNQLISLLRQESEGNIKFLLDEEHPTGDLYGFMNELDSCDSVIILCSPHYKDKSQTSGTDINYEFEKIKNKYNNILKRKQSEDFKGDISDIDFGVFPIIISIDNNKNKVSKMDAYPKYLDDNRVKYQRYTFVSIDDRKEVKKIRSEKGEKRSQEEQRIISISRELKNIDKANLKTIKHIIDATLNIKLSRAVTTLDKHDRMYRLIETTKAENSAALGAVFCRANFYNSLCTQNKVVFIGRKGSGKTQTISQYLIENKEKYKGAININANYIEIGKIFSYIFIGDESDFMLDTIKKPKLLGALRDVDSMFKYESLFRNVWHGYFFLHAIYIIAVEEKNMRLSAEQSKNIKTAENFINKLLIKIRKSDRYKNPKEVTSTLYEYAFFKCIEFYNNIIQDSRSEDEAQMMADITAANSLKGYLLFLLGEKCYESFSRTIKNCTKDIFISLDGFDNIQSENKGNRLTLYNKINKVDMDRMESTWLTSLLDVVTDIRNSNRSDNILNGHVDICLMVPFDRYIQSTLYKRDGFSYRELATTMSYRGIELCNLFTKRVKVVLDDSDDSIVSDKSALSSDMCIKEMELELAKFTNLFTEVEITLQNKTPIKIPVFLYILRYSFWRPRDIIDHIRSVFKIVINGESSNIEINSKMITRSVMKSSEEIVMKVIEEFSDIWINIKECLEKISYKQIITTYSDFENFLKNNSFSIVQANDKIISDPKAIVKFLYQIGFIGLILSNGNVIKTKSVEKQHQVFYSGNRPLSNLGDDSFAENSIYFNPVFSSRYNLLIETNEILGLYKWKDLLDRDKEVDCDYLFKDFNNY